MARSAGIRAVGWAFLLCEHWPVSHRQETDTIDFDTKANSDSSTEKQGDKNRCPGTSVNGELLLQHIVT